MYKTLVFFRDLQDGNRAYDVGDEYPRSGLIVSDERLKELASRDNIRGIPLIREVGPKAKKPEPVIVAVKEPEAEPETEKEEKPKTTKAKPKAQKRKQ